MPYGTGCHGGAPPRHRIFPTTALLLTTLSLTAQAHGRQHHQAVDLHPGDIAAADGARVLQVNVGGGYLQVHGAATDDGGLYKLQPANAEVAASKSTASIADADAVQDCSPQPVSSQGKVVSLLEAVSSERPCRVVMGWWPIGVSLELLSTFCGTVGKQLIRYSSSADSAWALRGGLLLIIAIGPILDLTAYSYAPASLLAPLAAFDVVWNTLIAPFTLHERLTSCRVASVVLIFIGTVLSIRNGSRSQLMLTEGIAHELLVRWQVGFYLACFGAWYTFNCFVLLRRPKGDVVRGFAIGATAGSCAGNMFLMRTVCAFVKAAVVQQSLAPCKDWLMVAAVLGAGFFSLSDLYLMTVGMREYEALFMVTLYQGAQVVANSVSACIVLLEMRSWPVDRILAQALCIGVVIVGLLVPLLDRRVGGSWQLLVTKEQELEKTGLPANNLGKLA
mmetsp:Transcript_54655/g.130423  ORF Transcript_54655/g.130423 Transcript_54655/m.130423 type:complete len:448 (-) Transcript_54655:171-1514(-)